MIGDRQLEFFGIGSNSFHDLSTVSFAFRFGGSSTLVDCGPTTPSNIYTAGYEFTDFDRLVLTHRHPDHCLGASYFLFGRHLEALQKGRSNEQYEPEPLEVVAERDVLDFVLDAYEFCHGGPEKAYEIEFTDLADEPASIPVGETADLRPVPVDHTVPTYGFVIHQGGEKPLAYSADTLPTDAFASAAEGCGTLIHEAMVPHSQEPFSRKTKHATGTDAGTVTDTVSPDDAFLVHLRPAHVDEAADIEAEAAAECGIEPVYPEPYEVIDF